MNRGRPRDYDNLTIVSISCDSKFKARLQKLSERNNESISRVVERAVSEFYPESRDLVLRKNELLQELQEIELSEEKQEQVDKVKRKKLVEQEAVKVAEQSVVEEYNALLSSNRGLMNKCYAMVREDRDKFSKVELLGKCIGLFKEKELSK